MYAFLDRQVWDIDEPYRFLLAAMRGWVHAARSGRCPCAAVAGGFVARGAPLATRDFLIAMSAIDRDGIGPSRFGARGCASVGEDEARLLALFECAMAGVPDRVRRVAATLVRDDAAEPLATAAEWVAVHLSGGAFVERDA